MDAGILVVISGLTGSGKDTVKEVLLKRHPEFKSIVTHTTRPPRKGEINGLNHYFVSRKEFEKMIQTGKFLEWIDYLGDYYGTSKEEFFPVLRGEDRIWRIDLTMAAKTDELFREKFDPETAKELIKRTLGIYLDVDRKTLKNRLIKRGTPLQEIEKRMEKERRDLEEVKTKLKNKVPNPDGKLGQAVKIVENLIITHKERLQNEKS